MKKSILIAAAVMFSALGFSQTAETSAKPKSEAHCAKGKKACCAEGEKKACCAKGESAEAKSDKDMVDPVNATDPRKKEKSDKKKSSSL
jgi:hypothetical protein